MSNYELVMLFWVLPSLVSALMIFSASREEGEPIEEWGVSHLYLVVFFTILYPVTFAVIIIVYLFPSLIKER